MYLLLKGCLYVIGACGTEFDKLEKLNMLHLSRLVHICSVPIQLWDFFLQYPHVFSICLFFLMKLYNLSKLLIMIELLVSKPVQTFFGQKAQTQQGTSAKR